MPVSRETPMNLSVTGLLFEVVRWGFLGSMPLTTSSALATWQLTKLWKINSTAVLDKG